MYTCFTPYFLLVEEPCCVYNAVPVFFMVHVQDTEPESYTNGAEPWKQSVGGLVAPRTFAARFFVTR